jgi:DNA repair protein RecO (recombination protein O)|tara:strand:+ start:365 stop:1123 length:759 start_codon:yes stop_codon:yes gene_type:complete
MPEWNDLGIVLSAKKYGEKGLVINILTENHGRYLGWLNYYKNKSVLADVQPGNLVNVFWKSRLIEQMGKFKIELISSVSGKIFDEKLKLQALNSMCSILEKVLPERQSYSEIFNASNAFINLLTLQDQRKNDHWIEGYVKWEIGVLSSIGFSLDLERCAVTGAKTNLYFVSPKTGKAVSKEGAGKHAPKLLLLPFFLGGEKVIGSNFYKEILAGLNITSYFFKNKLLLSINTNKAINLPKPRIRFVELIEKL